MLVSHRSAAYLHGFERIDEPGPGGASRCRGTGGRGLVSESRFMSHSPSICRATQSDMGSRSPEWPGRSSTSHRSSRSRSGCSTMRFASGSSPGTSSGVAIWPTTSSAGTLRRSGGSCWSGMGTRRRVASSPARMADMLTGAGLPMPVFEHLVEVNGHRYYLDLAWPHRMVAVECNDAGSHDTPKAFRRDPMKRNRCERRRLALLRVHMVGHGAQLRRGRRSGGRRPRSPGLTRAPALFLATRPSQMERTLDRDRRDAADLRSIFATRLSKMNAGPLRGSGRRVPRLPAHDRSEHDLAG